MRRCSERTLFVASDLFSPLWSSSPLPGRAAHTRSLTHTAHTRGMHDNLWDCRGGRWVCVRRVCVPGLDKAPRWGPKEVLRSVRGSGRGVLSTDQQMDLNEGVMREQGTYLTQMSLPSNRVCVGVCERGMFKEYDRGHTFSHLVWINMEYFGWLFCK